MEKAGTTVRRSAWWIRIAGAAAVATLAGGLVAPAAQAGPDTWWDGNDGVADWLDVVQYKLALTASTFTSTFSFRQSVQPGMALSTQFTVRLDTDDDGDEDFRIVGAGGWSDVRLVDADGIEVGGCPVTTSTVTLDRSVSVSSSCLGAPESVAVDAWFGDPSGSNVEYLPNLSAWSLPVVLNTPPGPDAPLAVVQRFWSPGFNNAHFFTINDLESAAVFEDPNWIHEGPAFIVAAAQNNVCPVGNPPVYRFWSPVFQSHFFTMNRAEYEHLSSSDRNWISEGVAYCAADGIGPGRTFLYRFWSPVYGKHFFTTDEAEAAQLRDHDPAWQYEDVAYLVYE